MLPWKNIQKHGCLNVEFLDWHYSTKWKIISINTWIYLLLQQWQCQWSPHPKHTRTHSHPAGGALGSPLARGRVTCALAAVPACTCKEEESLDAGGADTRTSDATELYKFHEERLRVFRSEMEFTIAQSCCLVLSLLAGKFEALSRSSSLSFDLDGAEDDSGQVHRMAMTDTCYSQKTSSNTQVCCYVLIVAAKPAIYMCLVEAW